MISNNIGGSYFIDNQRDDTRRESESTSNDNSFRNSVFPQESSAREPDSVVKETSSAIISRDVVQQADLNTNTDSRSHDRIALSHEAFSYENNIRSNNADSNVQEIYAAIDELFRSVTNTSDAVLPTPLESRVLEAAPLGNNDVQGKISTAEIYEQSHYATGKLSYLSQIEATQSTAYYSAENGSTNNIRLEILLAQQVYSIAPSRVSVASASLPTIVMDTGSRPDSLSKNVTLSAKASSLSKAQEYEKSKITLSERSGELHIYVRDYFSSEDEQVRFFDQLILQNDKLFSPFDRVVLNGKTIFTNK